MVATTEKSFEVSSIREGIQPRKWRIICSEFRSALGLRIFNFINLVLFWLLPIDFLTSINLLVVGNSCCIWVSRVMICGWR
ncbi:hypothetical protein L6452_04169 [Arctium lappa]|uniref:Uncharacterized protein n=1 Tax=Arctium lappa TaxID=4217 RepID=A0ACB9FNP0_ARCLA|nr:hypothetical protein L6452_04169 [Arctium lappa]